MATIELTTPQRLACDLDRHVAVTAGAGSGKTRVLTERYVRALERLRGTVNPLRRIVALTFTEKATIEMRGRVREMISDKLRAASRAGDRERVLWWREIRANLITARISTIHAFCAAMLRDNPLDVAIDPTFEVVDAAEATLLAAEAVRGYLATTARRSSSESTEAAALERLLGTYRSRELRRLLELLIRERTDSEDWLLEPLPDPDDRLRHTRDQMEQRARMTGQALRNRVSTETFEMIIEASSRHPGDKLGETLAAVAPLARQVLSDDVSVELIQTTRPALVNGQGKARGFGNKGRKSTWGSAINELRASLKDLAAAFADETAWFAPFDPEMELVALSLEGDLRTLYTGLHRYYGDLLGEGERIDFAGLELSAVKLLARETVASRIRTEIEYLLVDEFQDTNRIQWSILRRLLGEGGEASKPNFFIVGDDKQAIYEFRGGRVELFLRAQEWIRDRGGDVISLNDNFRSLPTPIGLVNDLFTGTFSPSPEREYEPMPQTLVAKRGEPETTDSGRVELLVDHAEGDLSQSRDAEADRIAHVVGSFVRSGLGILDPETQQERPATWSDIAVIFFDRRLLQNLEDAFLARAIPFDILGGRGFYQTTEIGDARTLLHTLTDPRNEIALAAALRSPLFGFSDDLLWRIASAPGETFVDRFWTTAEDAGTSGQLAWSRNLLSAWREIAGRAPTAALLSTALDESGYRAVTAATPNGPRRLANLEKLLDLIHRFEKSHGIDPARVVAWLDEQSEHVHVEGEAPDPTEPDGVSLMTIHAAKGTEFPIVVVAGMSERDRRVSEAPMCVLSDGETTRLALKVPLDNSDDRLEKTARYRLIEAEKQDREWAEQKRVLYVAMTRARDHLILSTRAPSKKPSKSDERAPRHWLDRHPQLGDALSQTAGGTGNVGGVALHVVCPGELGRPSVEPDLRLARAAEDALMSWAPPAAIDAPATSSAPLTTTRTGAVRVTDLSELTVCPRRYFYRRIVGLLEDTVSTSNQKHDATPGDSSARQRGILVHNHLAAFGRPTAGSETGGTGDRTADTHLRAFLESDRAREILAAGGGLTEVPFVLVTPGGRIEGAVDRLYRAPDGVWTVLDYKTTRVTDEDHARKTDASHGYDVQLLLYAIASAKFLSLEADDRIRMIVFYTSRGVETVREMSVRELPSTDALGETLSALRERTAGGREQDFTRRVYRTDGPVRDLLTWTNTEDTDPDGPHCVGCPYQHVPCGLTAPPPAAG